MFLKLALRPRPLARVFGGWFSSRHPQIQLDSHGNVKHFQWGKIYNWRLSSGLATSIRLPTAIGNGDSVHVELDTTEGKTVKTSFHLLWLRDSCQCPQCYSATTNQRLLDTSSLSTELRAQQVSVVDQTSLAVTWEDGHRSTYSGNWLLKHYFDSVPNIPVKRVVWGREIADAPPTLSYSSVMNQDMGVLELYNNMEVYGFCLVKESPVDPSATEAFINRIGMVRHTFYGGFCVIKPDLNKKDTAYSNVAIDPHTDSNYLHNPPGMLLFHTLEFDGPKPCLNYLVDGEKLRQTIRAENPRLYSILCSVPLCYHHWDEQHKYLNSFVPFRVDPHTDRLLEMHFNNHDRLPVSKASLDALLKVHPDGTMSDIYQAIQTLIRTSKREDILYEIRLEPGTVLIIDNHRLMHARSEFTGHRVLVATYMDKEDLLSTVMSIKENTM